MKTFSATLSGQPGTPTGIEVPAHVISALGPKKNPTVRILISGPTTGEYSSRSTVAVMGSVFMVPLSAAHRAASGIHAGDPLSVSLELDTEPRLVEVLADLAAALSEKAGASEAFAALAPQSGRKRCGSSKTPGRRKPVNAA